MFRTAALSCLEDRVRSLKSVQPCRLGVYAVLFWASTVYNTPGLITGPKNPEKWLILRA